jgi:transposase
VVLRQEYQTGLSRACRYDPDLNSTYQEMAMHCGVGVVPARPYKPRDKAKAENGVSIVERWIMASLRNHRFFEVGELNRAIGELLVKFNNRSFRKRGGTRESRSRPSINPHSNRFGPIV